MTQRAPVFAWALSFLAVLVVMTGGVARAEPRLGRALQKLVRKHYSAFHGCYRPLLAQDRSRAGTVFLQLEAGRGGRIISAKVARDELEHAGLARCLTSIVRSWSLRELEPLARVVLPLTFRADPKQFSVRSADLRRYGRASRSSLLVRKNVGIRQARMLLLRIDRAQAVDEHLAALLFVLEGRGRLVSKSGRTLQLRAGEVVMPRVGRFRLEAQAPLRIVSVSPIGHEPKLARRPRRLGRWQGARAFRYRAADGSLFASVRALEAGRELSARVLSREEALIYVLEGQGEAVVEGRTVHIESGVAVGVEAGRRYGLRAISALRLLVVYAPAGPERRP